MQSQWNKFHDYLRVCLCLKLCWSDWRRISIFFRFYEIEHNQLYSWWEKYMILRVHMNRFMSGFERKFISDNPPLISISCIWKKDVSIEKKWFIIWRKLLENWSCCWVHYNRCSKYSMKQKEDRINICAEMKFRRTLLGTVNLKEKWLLKQIQKLLKQQQCTKKLSDHHDSERLTWEDWKIFFVIHWSTKITVSWLLFVRGSEKALFCTRVNKFGDFFIAQRIYSFLQRLSNLVTPSK